MDVALFWHLWGVIGNMDHRKRCCWIVGFSHETSFQMRFQQTRTNIWYVDGCAVLGLNWDRYRGYMWYMHVHRWSRFFAEYCLFYFSVGERLIDTLFAPSLQLTWFDWLDSKSIHHCIFWRLTGSRVSIAVVCVSVPIWLWSYQITIHRIWKSSVLSIKYSIS